MKLHAALLIGQCLVQPPPQKLLPVADGNKERDPQLNNVQRDFGTFIPKWDVSKSAPPRGSGNSVEEKVERMQDK